MVCFGDLTGSFNIQGSGGVTPYLYSIDNSSNQSSSQFLNLGVGSYTIQVIDLNGCEANQTTEIVNLNPAFNFSQPLQT